MDEIIIVESDPHWQTQFVEETTNVRKALGNALIVAIEHIGSTAIPGLAAKPIIDLLVGVHSLELAQNAIPALEAIEYVYWTEDPRPGRMFFVKGMPPFGRQRTHHLHMVEVTSEFWEERLLFRDYLRSHPDQVQRYEVLKRCLANHFKSDREAYTQGKTEYVQSIVAKARQSIDSYKFL